MVEPNEELQLVFDKAIKDAKKLNHEYVTLEHLLFSMLCSEAFYNLLKGYGCQIDEMKTQIESDLTDAMNVLPVSTDKFGNGSHSLKATKNINDDLSFGFEKRKGYVGVTGEYKF